MIRVIVARDHHLARQGIRALLERAHDIEVVAEAAIRHQPSDKQRTSRRSQRSGKSYTRFS